MHHLKNKRKLKIIFVWTLKKYSQEISKVRNTAKLVCLCLFVRIYSYKIAN